MSTEKKSSFGLYFIVIGSWLGAGVMLFVMWNMMNSMNSMHTNMASMATDMKAMSVDVKAMRVATTSMSEDVAVMKQDGKLSFREDPTFHSEQYKIINVETNQEIYSAT